MSAWSAKLYEVREVFAGTLLFGLERAGEVLAAWRDWTASVPDEVMSCGRMLQLPPIPDIPEPFRRNSFVAVEVIMQLSEHQGADLLAPLRALGPTIDTVSTIRPVTVQVTNCAPSRARTTESGGRSCSTAKAAEATSPPRRSRSGARSSAKPGQHACR